MPPTTASSALVLAAALLLAPVAPAAASGACSSDTFSIDGTSVVVEICGPAAAPALRGGKPVPVSVTATLSPKSQTPISRKLTFDVTAADDAAHAIDDVPLGPLGIAKTLHVTIGYRAGTARLEHALLVPGAIALK